MNWWTTLDAGTRRLVAIVGGAAVAFLFLRSRNASSSADQADQADGGPALDASPTTDPGTLGYGTGDITANSLASQLSEWETRWATAFAGLQNQVDGITSVGTSTVPPAGGPLTPAQAKARGVLGRRRDTVRTRPGQRRGETMSELAQRLYGNRAYENEIRFFNNALWPGSFDKALPLGATVHY